MYGPRVHTTLFTTGSLMRDNYTFKAVVGKRRGSYGGRDVTNPTPFWNPTAGPVGKGGAMTPLGRHYHIPSMTVTDPERERVPRAGIPVVKRKRKRERKD